jgi:glycosyltransferase involved in cell wall biosynthesis
MTNPLVTIGMPVYNGTPHLQQALTALVEQTFTDVEILISDNASTDGTADLCRSFAARYPQIRYSRNDENVGAIRNFAIVLERARGKYFMWAAHDDRWDARFVELLVAKLEAEPRAVLAAPTVLHTNEDGSLRAEAPDRAPPGNSQQANLKQFYHDHSPSWIYGLYRVEWLRAHVDEIREYPIWGGDVIWLADVVQRFDVVGAQDAFLFKRLRRSGYSPRSARMAVVFWSYMAWHLSRNAWRRASTTATKLSGASMALRYVYRQCIRRPNILRTAWRVTRMLVLAAIETIPWACARWMAKKKHGATIAANPPAASRRAA